MTPTKQHVDLAEKLYCRAWLGSRHGAINDIAQTLADFRVFLDTTAGDALLKECEAALRFAANTLDDAGYSYSASRSNEVADKCAGYLNRESEGEEKCNECDVIGEQACSEHGTRVTPASPDHLPKGFVEDEINNSLASQRSMGEELEALRRARKGDGELIDGILEYAEHRSRCKVHNGTPYPDYDKCNCGLNDLITTRKKAAHEE